MKGVDAEKSPEELKADIQKMGEEIEHLKKTTEELRAKIQGEEKTGKTTELSSMIGEVSDLLEKSFNIFGISSKGQGVNKRTSGLVGLINDLARLAEKKESFQKEFELGGKKGVIDFHIRSGPLKRPPIRGRGISTRKPLKRGVEQRGEFFDSTMVKPIEEREPIVDIFEEKDEIIVMAELPGIEEKDINWNVEGDTLKIETSNSAGKYYKEIALPAPVEKKSSTSTYKNGILELKLRKT